MFHYFGTVTNTKGDSLPGWQIEVITLDASPTVVPIYSDENSTPISSLSGIANRAVSDVSGNYDFFVIDGTYSIRFYDENGVRQGGLRYVLMYGQQPVPVVPSTDVSPMEFGAVGDATSDDTAALIAAVATGKNVFLPTGYTFKFTSDIILTTDFQSFGGPGYLAPSGDCGIVVGPSTGVRLDVIFDAPTHTGTCVTISGGNRVTIENIYSENCYNGVYITKANTTTINQGYLSVRNEGLQWYGDVNNRSDILIIDKLFIGAGSQKYALIWDGNCNTLVVKYLGIIGTGTGIVSSSNGYGVIVRNTSGGPIPQIGRFEHLEVDFAGGAGVEIQCGLNYDFSNVYINGSAADGLNCHGLGLSSPAISGDYQLRIHGGNITGNGGYGINSQNIALVDGALATYSNFNGSKNGPVWVMNSRFALDASAYFDLTGTNVTVARDTNDYQLYDRTANTCTEVINGAATFHWDANRLAADKLLKFQVYTYSNLPSAVLGDSAVITDCTTATPYATAAGGGSNIVRVLYTGSAWKVA